MSFFDNLNSGKEKKKKPNIFAKIAEEKKDRSLFEKLNEHEVIIEKNVDDGSGSVSGKVLAKNNVAIPYYLSQTAIYAPRSASDRGDRNLSIPIWSQGKMTVSYQGQALDTKIDYRLMSIVLKARDQLSPEKHIVKLKYKETMKALGLNPHHPDARKKFHASIERHLSAKLFFSMDNEKEGFWKTLFEADKTVFSYTRNVLIIQLSDIVPMLFNYGRKETFSIEDMLLNFSIKDSYASKLYSYYESNKIPFGIKVSTILKICDHPLDDNEKPNNNHRQTIKKALNELVQIGFLRSWSFQEDKDKRDPLVIVEKIEREERQLTTKLIEFKDDFLDK
jgi:hypothetical protein